jgi:sugar fermentation stimulation protein
MVGRCRFAAMLKLPPLKQALFEERLNRFLVKVNIEGKSELAHLHDPGRLKELLLPGAKLYLQLSDNRLRKTAWDIILIKKGRVYVAIYSTLANRLVKKQFEDRTFTGFKSWRLVKSEPNFGKSRFDFELERKGEKMLIEVKSVSLVEDDVAMFPDAPTVRGRRHLLELAGAVKQGYGASVIFMVTRNDAVSFKPHSERDPEFAESLRRVEKKGVRLYCFKCNVTRKTIDLHSRIPIKLS